VTIYYGRPKLTSKITGTGYIVTTELG